MKYLINPGWVIMLFLLLFGYNLRSQTLLELGRRISNVPDTIYYPFYDGVQMIEIAHMSRWRAQKSAYDIRVNIEYYAKSSLPPPYPVPPPLSNEYYFRNKNGKIVKIFNSFYSVDSLQQFFKSDTIKQLSYKNHLPAFYNRFYLYDFTPQGYYKVFNAKNLRLKKKSLRFIDLHINLSPPTIKSQKLRRYAYDYPYRYQYLDSYYNTHKLYNHILNPEEVLFGLIDSLGKVTVPIEYQQLFFWKVNFLVKKQNKWGIIDKNNQVIFPVIYNQLQMKARDFLVLKADKSESLILYKDQMIKLKYYDDIKDYKPYFIVVENGKWGLLDSLGKQLIPCKYNDLYTGDRKRGYFIVKQNNLYGFIDLKTGRKSRVAFDRLGWISNNRIVFKKGELYGFLNSRGRVIIPAQYDQAYGFKSKVTAVKKGGKWGLINKKGKIIMPYKYHWISEYWLNHRTKVTNKKNLIGLINDQGKELVPCKYENIRYDHKRKIYLFKKNGIEYKLSKSGKMVKDD